jgi:hypothetical protein
VEPAGPTTTERFARGVLVVVGVPGLVEELVSVAARGGPLGSSIGSALGSPAVRALSGRDRAICVSGRSAKAAASATISVTPARGPRARRRLLVVDHRVRAGHVDHEHRSERRRCRVSDRCRCVLAARDHDRGPGPDPGDRDRRQGPRGLRARGVELLAPGGHGDPARDTRRGAGRQGRGHGRGGGPRRSGGRGHGRGGRCEPGDPRRSDERDLGRRCVRQRRRRARFGHPPAGCHVRPGHTGVRGGLGAVVRRSRFPHRWTGDHQHRVARGDRPAPHRQGLDGGQRVL